MCLTWFSIFTFSTARNKIFPSGKITSILVRSNKYYLMGKSLFHNNSEHCRWEKNPIMFSSLLVLLLLTKICMSFTWCNTERMLELWHYEIFKWNFFSCMKHFAIWGLLLFSRQLPEFLLLCSLEQGEVERVPACSSKASEKLSSRIGSIVILLIILFVNSLTSMANHWPVQ